MVWQADSPSIHYSSFAASPSSLDCAMAYTPSRLPPRSRHGRTPLTLCVADAPHPRSSLQALPVRHDPPSRQKPSWSVSPSSLPILPTAQRTHSIYAALTRRCHCERAAGQSSKPVLSIQPSAALLRSHHFNTSPNRSPISHLAPHINSHACRCHPVRRLTR